MYRAEISYWAEGPTDRAVARKLIEFVGGVPGPDYSGRRRASSGKAYLDANLRRFNAAAQYTRWFIIRDADNDCARELVSRLLPAPAQQMCFRVVVPAIEAWLMADRDSISDYLAISASRIPERPEEIDDVKGRLIEASRHSRSRTIRDGFLPVERSGRREGPGYAAGLIEFVGNGWDPQRASRNAVSLMRSINRLQELVTTSGRQG